MTGPAAGSALSAVLQRLAEEEGERVSIGDLLAALGDRALGALLFVFAFPNALPALPGTSAILGLPLVFLAAQLAFGRRPWLPRFIAARSMPRPAFRALVGRMYPWLQRAERLLRPRASALALPPMEYLVGAVCLVLAVVVLLPIPMGNMLPAFSISLLALGILERDGYWILAGLAAALASAALVSGVVIVFVKMALYAVAAWLPA
ncbi:exopolysaccharide biosynthesis protein [Massilia alkalitolerans]|uniref:exopolysaccharide biosynthesis protein n=1 Tax=Massilia alkalitolerans TaxID=286638 RepID=UPI000403D704|nr:exopolysaccharide biosynthesis protein [Massilia alkalitolerans]